MLRLADPSFNPNPGRLNLNPLLFSEQSQSFKSRKKQECRSSGEVAGGRAAAENVEDRVVAYVRIQIRPVFLHPHQDIQPDQS